MHCASETQPRAIKRVIRYIKGTVNFGVNFHKCPNFNMFGFSNRNWGDSIEDMKIIFGHCFSLGLDFFFHGAPRIRDCSTINCKSINHGSNFSSKSSHMAKKKSEYLAF